MPYAAAQGPTSDHRDADCFGGGSGPEECFLWDYIARKAQIGRPNLFALLPDYVFTVRTISDQLQRPGGRRWAGSS